MCVCIMYCINKQKTEHGKDGIKITRDWLTFMTFWERIWLTRKDVQLYNINFNQNALTFFHSRHDEVMYNNNQRQST